MLEARMTTSPSIRTDRPVTTRRLLLLPALALGALLTTACASTLSVNQVLADPSKYRNRDVQLMGRVVDSFSFANRGVYRIDDGTGQLWVASTHGVPRNSARVMVKGRVREGFNLGSFSDRIKLPAGLGTGLVLTESSHSAKD